MRNNNKKKKINKLNVVISILIAFSAWLYVVYNINPTTNRTYKDVPVKFANENVLKDNDLAISAVNIDKIDVTIRAKRTVLDEIDKKSILVSADLADAGLGKNVIALSITVPDDSIVTKQSEKSITVTVEERDTKTVEARAVFEAGSDENTEPLVKEQSEKEVEVSGAKSLIDKVSYAELKLNANKVTGKARTYSVKPVAVTKDGKKVKFISAKPKTISLTAINSITKEVNLIVNVNNPDNGYDRTYKAPSKVMIKGLSDDISNVNSISTENIDIGDVTTSRDIPLTFNLPKGVTLANESKGMTLSVTVKEAAEKTFSINSGKTSVNNVADGLNYSIKSTTLTVTVTGTEKQLSGLSAQDFTLTANASGLGEGTHSIPVKVSCRKTVKSVSVAPSSINVSLK